MILEESTLEDLLAATQAGDLAALDALVQRTRRPLYRYIYGMVGDPHTTEDVLQDVWLRALKHLHRFDRRHVMAWLFRIARNRVIDLSRKKKPDTSLQTPLSTSETPLTLEQLLPARGFDPATHTADRELGHRIRAALATLPPEQREVFVLRMEADVPFKTIAELQGVSINTALGRMQYALRRLREQLGAPAPQPGNAP